MSVKTIACGVFFGLLLISSSAVAQIQGGGSSIPVPQGDKSAVLQGPDKVNEAEAKIMIHAYVKALFDANSAGMDGIIGFPHAVGETCVIASNMANANTLGFRAELLDQRAVTIEGQPLEARAMQVARVRGADMVAGEIIETGRDLDIAMATDALMAVQAEDGTEAYTRRGDMSISATGLLVNGEGRPVLGDNGPITIPPVGIPGIAPDGTVTIADPATPDQPPAEVGRIKLAAWQGSPISKGLDGLFRVEGGGILPTDEAATVQVGALEQSNVKTTEVLVEMIDAQRLFAMRSKVIATAREIDESGAQLMRLG